MLGIFSAALVAFQACDTGRTVRPALHEYRMDAGHSFAGFSIRFALGRVRGRFTEAKGTILYDPVAPEQSSVTVVFDSKSIDTGWGNRDRHLRTSDFFDVEKYPTVEFRSTQLTRTSEGWIAEGELIMHGVTRRVAIPFRFLQPPSRSAESRWMLINVAGSVRLSRLDFGITGGSTFNSWFDQARAATMADSVDIELEFEGYRPDAASQRSPRINALLESSATAGVQSLISLLDSLKKAQPSGADGLINGGDLLVRGLIATCRVPEAVRLASAVTQLFPESHRARLVSGFAHAVGGDRAGSGREYAEAKRIFRPTVRDPNEKFPQDDPTWWHMDVLAQSALEWGFVRELVPLARTLADLYPETPRARVTYGMALAAAGDAQGAAAEYAAALALDPREARAMEWRRRLR